MFYRISKIRGSVAAVVLVAMVALARPARADDARVVVVDVKPAARTLDAAKVMQMIGDELHSEVVAPDDPRAANAQGTLVVDVDPTHAQLLVSFMARQSPIERRLPQTGDREAQRDAVVSIAGNLARDEASELVAELRKPRKPPQPVTTLDSQSDAERARELRQREVDQEAARMQATLDHYAQQDRASRHVVGVALMGTAVGATAIGVAVGKAAKDDLTWIAVGTTSVLLTATAITTYFTSTTLEDLAAFGRQPGARPYLAREWQNAANQEHAHRKTAVVGLLVGATAPLAVGALTLLNQREGNGRFYFGSWLVAIGAAEVVTAASLASTEGSVESGLHAFQRSSGQRSLESARAHRPDVGFAFTNGGVFGSLSMAF